MHNHIHKSLYYLYRCMIPFFRRHYIDFFFTPTTKHPTLQSKLDETSNEFLRACDINEALEALGQAVSVAQHHDAVTGTEKQHVASDYSKVNYRAIHILCNSHHFFPSTHPTKINFSPPIPSKNSS